MDLYSSGDLLNSLELVLGFDGSPTSSECCSLSANSGRWQAGDSVSCASCIEGHPWIVGRLRQCVNPSEKLQTHRGNAARSPRGTHGKPGSMGRHLDRSAACLEQICDSRFWYKYCSAKWYAEVDVAPFAEGSAEFSEFLCWGLWMAIRQDHEHD